MRIENVAVALSIVINVTGFAAGVFSVPFFLALIALNIVAIVFLVKAAKMRKATKESVARRILIEGKMHKMLGEEERF
jgi:hypothetical protein